MRNLFIVILLIIFITAIPAALLFAQMQGLHGDFTETRNGEHAGNQFRTTFYNDGTFGVNQRPPDIGGEWPINSGHDYMLDGNVFVGSEVIDTKGDLKHIFSEVRSGGTNNTDQWSTGDISPDGEWRTFLPLPGFASPDTDKIAMSKWPWAWPPFWPDIADPDNKQFSSDGWAGSWNGYFGRDVFNADEESYFIADDYNNDEFSFYPDANDSSRRGLALRMYVRGFQWSNALVEDALFVLFDLENIGTFSHDKVVFAYKFGNNMGDTEQGWDSGDDMGAYNREEDVAYLYDYDDIGYGGFTPVGFFGGAFLESPGNPYDGIDNDGDGINGSGVPITEDTFAPKTLAAGQDIILIDYHTFERIKTQLPNDTLVVQYQDLVFKYWPGKVVREEPFDLVDNNLNGIIDENNGVTFGEGDQQITTYLYLGEDTHILHVDYFSGAGEDNKLIDERRDDGIDNDDDWDSSSDDLGTDGLNLTMDEGEEDGIPTYGEPHFDKTDIDETDMLGLTSFTLYRWEDIPHWEDEIVWDNVIPGRFDALMENDNIELLYGSGYFPLIAGNTERFSMGIICGENLTDFLVNKFWIAKAYGENYNFSKSPAIPKLTAIPGDGKVTLVWDDRAEESFDPITGYDFEGYRIYRSTDPGWNDMIPISDGYGSTIYRKPIKQFDLDNLYSGFAMHPIKGTQFYLGDNTGITHIFVDSTVQNGYEYYYAVTSYDHGSDSLGIPPSECSKFISQSTSGQITKGDNVIVIRPEAPSLGFRPAGFVNSEITKNAESTTQGTVSYQIIIPDSIRDGHEYQITFEDSTTGTSNYPITKNFTVTDLTTGEVLIDKSTEFNEDDELPVTHGFRLKIVNGEGVTQLNIDTENSSWNNTGIYPYNVRPFRATGLETKLIAGNFEVVFGDVGLDTSTLFDRGTEILPAIPVNFTIRNTITNKNVLFALRERDVLPGEEGKFTTRSAGTRADEVILLDDSNPDTLFASWQLSLANSQTDTLQPGPGDVLTLAFFRPFLSHDIFNFKTRGAYEDKQLAKAQMDMIKVVPNPYVVTNSWEPTHQYSTGRGPRELHFIHLPMKCTIKIFTVRGQLVAEIEHDETITNGTEIWNMLTKDEMDVAYGVYIYHVDAGDIGQKIGKFAIIK